MKGHVVIMLTLSVVVPGCRRPENRMATQLSNLATTPEQARLWKEAADRGLAVGLQKLEQTDRPVQSRQASTVADRSIPAPPVAVFPASVTSAVRIVSTTGLGTEYSGLATVRAVNDEQVQLDLGNNRTIAFQARAGGRALAIMPGQTMRVDYRVRNERLNRRQILAFRAPDGTGIARITETGSSPVTVSVPLFELVATQLAGTVPARGTPPTPPTSVDVRVGNDRKTIVPGEIAQIGGITVGLMSSRAITGPEAKALEGSPYALELIAWSNQ